MNSKVLVKDYASLLEVKLINSFEEVRRFIDADIFINLPYGSVIGKMIIINLPVEVPLDQLLEDNVVVSRFRISDRIPIVSYNLPENRKSIPLEDYSCLILNKLMFTNMKYAKVVSENNFLVGVLETIDNDATLIGEKILLNKIEDL